MSSNDGEEQRPPKRRRDLSLEKRSEEYDFCPLHNRRYPHGGQCPSCAALNKRRP
jgi:hypothetical protein